MSGLSPHKTIKVSSTSFTRPADATAYAAGDEVSNSSTAGSVVRPVFDFTGFTMVHPKEVRIAWTPASGNTVVTNADFEILLFKTDDVPSAVGDNTTHPITAPKAIEASRFLPVAGGWLNQLGAAAAGTSATQRVGLAVGNLATDSFEFKQGETQSLTAVVRALSAWNPGNVAQDFSLFLEVEV